jgi:hypothetical protein
MLQEYSEHVAEAEEYKLKGYARCAYFPGPTALLRCVFVKLCDLED